jgi:hypothetical protein
LQQEQLIGVAPERLDLQQRKLIAGKWIALELYSPKTLPLRVIAAVADSSEACAQAIHAQGKDPCQFEYVWQPSSL